MLHQKRNLALGLLALLLIIGAFLSLGRGNRAATTRPVVQRDVPVRELAGQSSAGSPVQARVPSDEPSRVPDVGPGVILHGTVVRKGSAVPDAQVQCRVFAAIRTTANTDNAGTFRFEQLPEAPTYELVAFTESGRGRVEVRYKTVLRGPVQVEIQDVLYERLRFVDRAGAAIPVAGLARVDPARVACIWRSEFQGEFYDEATLPSLFRPLSELKENEVAYLSDFSSNGVATGGSRRRVLDIPGYKPVDIPVEPWSPERWPEARTIVLEEDPSEQQPIVFRVRMPRDQPPESWESGSYHPFRLGVAAQGDRPASHWVTPGRASFREVRGTDFKVSRLESGALQFRFVTSGDEAEIIPVYPRYGFVDLTFRARHPEDASAQGFAMLIGASGRMFFGRTQRPGHVRFSYLPAGDYRIQIAWERVAGSDPLPAWKLKRLISVGGGHSVYAANDDS